MDDSASRLRQERDLYRGLLRLGAESDVRAFMDEALRRIVAATGSHQGYLALYGGADLGSTPPFEIAHDYTEQEVELVRARLSGGIVRAALDKGETVSTASALDDPRFSSQKSVAAYEIRAVMCAPVGDAALGVIYLQGRDDPSPFLEEDRRLLEDFAAHIEPYAERLLREAAAPDPTAPLREQLEGLEGIAGRSEALAGVFRQVALVAPLDVTVLLSGPSGAGKTALAHAIHANSPRVLEPFLELNCAAIPEQLIESELFGAEKGAHSTADRRIGGKVEASEGGTLFLDEVGELPLAAQAKLLQFLQSRTYFPLGASTPREADVRLLVATNVDLAEAVADKRFREDLYYRLAVLPLAVPALGERPEDVGPIAEALIDGAARRHRLTALPLSGAGRGALEACEWPGNVRQLANAIEAGLIRANGQGATRIEPAHLFPGTATTDEAETFHAATRAFQRRFLQKALEESDWNVSATARALDVSRSRLNELIRGFELQRPKS